MTTHFYNFRCLSPKVPTMDLKIISDNGKEETSPKKWVNSNGTNKVTAADNSPSAWRAWLSKHKFGGGSKDVERKKLEEEKDTAPSLGLFQLVSLSIERRVRIYKSKCICCSWMCRNESYIKHKLFCLLIRKTNIPIVLNMGGVLLFCNFR